MSISLLLLARQGKMDGDESELQAFEVARNAPRRTDGFYVKRTTLIIVVIAVLLLIVLVGVTSAYLGPGKTKPGKWC